MSSQAPPERRRTRSAAATKPRTTRPRRGSAFKAVEQQRRQRQLYRISAAAVVVVLIAGGAGWWLVNRQANSWKDQVQQFSYTGRQHQEGTIAYDLQPPAGGAHNPVWQNCGSYSQPITDENAVHSLEHGALWITYRPDLPADQVQKLQQIADSQTYVLVSPYPGLKAPVVATTWDNRIQLSGANDPLLTKFVRAYRLGPDTPEKGAACTGGTSATKG